MVEPVFSTNTPSLLVDRSLLLCCVGSWRKIMYTSLNNRNNKYNKRITKVCLLSHTIIHQHSWSCKFFFSFSKNNNKQKQTKQNTKIRQTINCIGIPFCSPFTCYSKLSFYPFLKSISSLICLMAIFNIFTKSKMIVPSKQRRYKIP